MALGLAASSPSASAEAPAGPYAAHSMVYAYGMPLAEKERAFAEAKAMGASEIRLDIELNSVFTRTWGTVWRSWSGVDEVMALSRKYDMPVLAILIGVPEFLSSCRGADARKCAARDPGLYGNYAAEVAAHTRGVIDSFEIINEPDTDDMFRGTPEDYARMLASAHNAIKARSPGSTVVLGGVSGLAATGWLTRVFATPGVDAARKFDIAGVHLRGSVGSLANVMRAWRGFFDSRGRPGVPLWVTEHGYPADPAYQHDPTYRGGEAAQAAYLRDSLSTLVRAGAGRIFVSTRDTWPNEYGPNSPYNSEGIASVSDNAPYSARRRPAWNVFRLVAGMWPRVPHSVAEEARLSTARDASGLQGRSLTSRRDVLSTRARALRRTITRLRQRVRRAQRAHRPRQVRALRRQIRSSQRKLGSVKRMGVSAKTRADARFLQALAYQAQLDAGP